MQLRTMFVAWSLAALAGAAFGDSSCSAKNDDGGRCQATCVAGQTAQCKDESGSLTPTCECTGEPTDGGLVLRRGKLKLFNLDTAVVTNVKESTSAKLVGLRDYKLANSCQSVLVGQQCDANTHPGCATCAPVRKYVCSPIYEDRCTTVTGKLTLTELLLPQTVEAVVKEPNWKAIPSEYLGLKETYTNCSTEKQSATYKHSEKVTVGQKITKSNALDTERAIGAKVSYAWNPGQNGEISASFKQTVRVSQQEEQTNTEEKYFEVVQPLNFGIMKRYSYDHAWIRREIPIEYAGVVVVDATLASNMEGVTLLSQVLQEKDRTFPFSGVITDTRSYEGQTSLRETELKPADCASPQLFIDSQPYLVVK